MMETNPTSCPCERVGGCDSSFAIRRVGVLSGWAIERVVRDDNKMA